jgi:hypothetical protein
MLVTEDGWIVRLRIKRPEGNEKASAIIKDDTIFAKSGAAPPRV